MGSNILASIAAVGVCLLCLFGVFSIVDMASASKITVGSGVVIDKVYSPASSGTGVGFPVGGKSTSPVVMTTYSEEEWVLIVKVGGETFSEKVDAATWGTAEKGGSLEVYRKQGMLGSYGLTVKRR